MRRRFFLSHTLTGHREMYSESRLKPLRSYRYQGVDKSFISRYILVHYWNWAVTLFPMWMAPNLITFVGLGFMLAALATALVLIPDLSSPGPSWVYFFFALCLWLYSTLDNVDGKQARRTGTSSPLGELFDHGCDALNCSIGGLVQIAAMGLDSSIYSMLLLGITFWAFYLPTWEEYHTGVLYLGHINGPTEGLLLAIGMMLISGVAGPAFWQRTLAEQFPSAFPGGTFLGDLANIHVTVVFFLSLFLFAFVPICLLTVRRECRARHVSYQTALMRLMPMVILSVAAMVWLLSPFSRLRRGGHFPLFVLTFGLVFGKMATKIIYAHLTKLPFPYYTGLALPLFAGAFLINLPAIIPACSGLVTAKGELAFLWIWFLIAVVGYTNWSYHVVRSFCEYLDIYCFSIKARSQ